MLDSCRTTSVSSTLSSSSSSSSLIVRRQCRQHRLPSFVSHSVLLFLFVLISVWTNEIRSDALLLRSRRKEGSLQALSEEGISAQAAETAAREGDPPSDRVDVNLLNVDDVKKEDAEDTGTSRDVDSSSNAEESSQRFRAERQQEPLLEAESELSLQPSLPGDAEKVAETPLTDENVPNAGIRTDRVQEEKVSMPTTNGEGAAEDTPSMSSSSSHQDKSKEIDDAGDKTAVEAQKKATPFYPVIEQAELERQTDVPGSLWNNPMGQETQARDSDWMSGDQRAMQMSEGRSNGFAFGPARFAW